MNEKVVAFLNKKDQIIKRERDRFLIELGLVQKVYSPDNTETYEYSKHDYSNGEKKYYKEIALDVTEEEYLEIVKRVKMIEEIEEREKSKLKKPYHFDQVLTPLFEIPKETYPNNEESIHNGTCALANILRVIAWIMWFFGFIIGIIAAFEEVSLVLVIWISAFLSGILIYSIAQILDYLALITTFLQYGFKFTKTKK